MTGSARPGRTRGGLRGGAPVALVGLAGALAVPAARAQGPVLYAPNQASASVSVIDARTRRVLETVDLQALGFAADSRPHHTVVEPDGSYWYVSLIGARKVLKFDRANRLAGQADVEAAGMLALDPSSDRLLVAPSMTAVNPPSRIGVVDRRTMRTLEPLEVLVARPHALALHPRGRYAYVGSVATNQLAVVDLETERVAPVTVDGPPNTFVQFAVAPDGSRLVVTGQLSGDLLVFDLADPGAPRYLTRVHVGAGPYHPAYAPDGRAVYVAVQRDNAVAIVDARDWRVRSTIRDSALAQPHGLAPSRDGRWLFVSNENVGGPAPAGAHAEHGGMRHDAPAASPAGRVAVIDLAAGRVVAAVDTGRQTAGLSLSPTP